MLRELNHLDTNLPLMVEHLPGEVEYRQATTYLRTVIAEIDVSL